MEHLKQQDHIINLGNLLVKQLGLEDEVDTLSRWMAHYLAEKITLAEKLPQGEEKNNAQKECFETILKLWENRWELPPGKRPLEDYEPILTVLEKINPEKKEPFYYNKTRPISGLNENSNEINKYVEAIEQIDKTARIWIDFLLQQATSKATNERTKSILENALESPHNYDMDSIQILIDNMEDFTKKYQDETFGKRIKELEKFAELNKFILEQYEYFFDNEE